MRLKNCRLVGRYREVATGRECNVHKGTRAERGTDHYFYLLRQKRVFISAANMGKDWVLVGARPPALKPALTKAIAEDQAGRAIEAVVERAAHGKRLKAEVGALTQRIRDQQAGPPVSIEDIKKGLADGTMRITSCDTGEE